MSQTKLRNPIVIGTIVVIAVLVIVLLVSGYLLFGYLSSYQQRVAAPIATTVALLSTPVEPPTPADEYSPDVTPLATPLPSKPAVVRHDVSLQVAPYAAAPLRLAANGTPVKLVQGEGVIVLAVTERGWWQVRLEDGAEGWVPSDALQ